MELTEQDLGRSVAGISLISLLQGPPRSFRGPDESDSPTNRASAVFSRYSLGRLQRVVTSPRYPAEPYPFQVLTTTDGGYHLVFAGVQDRSQFPSIAAGYATALSPNNPIPGWNFVVASRVRPFLRSLAPSLRDARYIDVYGHSFGGMVAECVASEMDTVGAVVRNLVTYGTPKPAMAAYANRSDGTRRLRWIADNDPVPLLPFGRLGGLQEYLLATLAVARAGRRIDVAQWRHLSDGLAVSSTRIATSYEPRGLVNPGVTLEAWLSGQRADSNAHEAEHYRQLLAGWWDVRPQVTTTRRPTSPIPQRQAAVDFVLPFNVPTIATPGPDVVLPIVIGPGDEAWLTNSNVARVVPAGARRAIGNSPAISVGVGNVANGKLAANAGFVRVKSPGYGWVIYLRGTVVAAVSSGSRAKTLVRKGNALLRYMGNLAWSSTATGNAMQEAIEAYQAGDGYTPPMTPLS